MVGLVGLGVFGVGGFEAGAAADGGDFQVERGVGGEAAGLNEVVRSFVLEANLDQLRLVRGVLAEVGAKAALTFLYLQHVVVLSSWLRERKDV